MATEDLYLNHADFSDMARRLHAQAGYDATLDSVCQLARAVIGSQHAGITVTRGQGWETVAATDEEPYVVDALQYASQEGPCVDAIRHSQTYYAPDLATEDRWPVFAQTVIRETSTRAMLSERLYLEDRTFGALNLYSAERNAFAEVDAGLLRVFATYAALAIDARLKERQLDNIQVALRSNRQIGMAMGILMHRHHLTASAAFDRLSTASQHRNRKVVDLAQDVVDTGDLPGPERT